MVKLGASTTSATRATLTEAKLMTRISIGSMLRGEFTTALFPGNRLEHVGKFLGVPERWDFGIEDEFICQIGYGDFELNLRTRANCVEVERIWIELWGASEGRPVPKTTPIRLNGRVQVDLGEFRAGVPLSAAKAALNSLNLHYQEFDPNEGSDVVARLLLPTNVEMDFFKGEREPVLMEIHFFSTASGAV